MSRDMSGSSLSYILAGQTPDLRSNISVACWFQADVITGGPRLMSRWGSGTTQRFLLGPTSGSPQKLAFNILGSDGNGQGVTGATTISAASGTWRHAAATYEPSTALRVYLDGAQDAVNTTSIKSALAAGTTQRILGLGAESNGDVQRLNGRLAEVAIWDVTLTADEILALSKGVPPGMIRRGSLRNYLPLWGVAYNEIDLTGTANGTDGGSTPVLYDHAPVGCPFPVAT